MATQVIQRANNSSNLYANIKARGSNSGPAGCGYIYASEVNQCPCWRHKVKVTPQNSPGYDRTVRFELPNYGFLEHVFLESHFAQAITHFGTIHAGSSAGQATDLAGHADKYAIGNHKHLLKSMVSSQKRYFAPHYWPRESRRRNINQYQRRTNVRRGWRVWLGKINPWTRALET